METLVQKGEGQPLEVFNKFVGEYISSYLPGVDTERMGAIVEAAHEPATSPASLLQSIGDTVKPVEVQGSKNKTFFGIQLTPPQDVKITAIKAALAQENQREIYFPVDEKATLQGQQVHCYVLVRKSDLDKVPKAKGWVKASPEEAAVVEIFSRSHGNKKSIFEGLWVETAKNAAGVCVLNANHNALADSGNRQQLSHRRATRQKASDWQPDVTDFYECLLERTGSVYQTYFKNEILSSLRR